MNLDDVIYMSILLLSIGFGKIYLRIHETDYRKKIGTILGLVIIAIVSGLHVVHPLISFYINALIIRNIHPKKCHIVSFIFSFLYLFFFRTTIYFGIPYPPAHTNLIQMILTLKIVGLAFEVNRSYTNTLINKSEKTGEEIARDEYNEINLNITEMFHYCFNYIGVLTGPYYRYTTFRDSFVTPYAAYGNNWTFTLNKLKFVPLFIVLFLWSSYTWPLNYAVTSEFYERSWLYRYWYIWPNFFTFRMRMYIGLVLSECVCTMGGLGIYPVICKSKSGEGPTDKFTLISQPAENIKDFECNYDTIKNINPYGADFCVSYRDGMKHWNICIQYWLAVNVYKYWPSKKYRTYVTLLVSAVWHGVYTGYYVCIATVPFVLMIEDIWMKLLLKDVSTNKSELQIKTSKGVIWFFKMHFFSYQAIAMHLLELRQIFHYYNSVYHAGLIVAIGLYIIGLQLYRSKKHQEQKINSKLNDQNEDQKYHLHSN